MALIEGDVSSEFLSVLNSTRPTSAYGVPLAEDFE